MTLIGAEDALAARSHILPSGESHQQVEHRQEQEGSPNKWSKGKTNAENIGKVEQETDKEREEAEHQRIEQYDAEIRP